MTPTERVLEEINTTIDWLVIEAHVLDPIGKTPNGETIYIQRIGRQTDLEFWRRERLSPPDSI